MKHYFFRLAPPRPTFAFDMNDHEKAVMGQHMAYWKDLFEKGKIVLYGPVMDANGPWGLGIMEVADEAEAQQIAANDPSVTAGVNTYQLYPVMVGMMR